ncbi:hypothetical protein BDD43_3227 [Mucilaginibacter gracilis]|uniref:EF hand domain-containing protein n=1 Tax=Mucilaginibacter gracilis TaxID=423350 RepID=A0A495J260_9SPHI|nr:hypothetical protein [Mucilaginibacter gracilis]RKR83027.1 hypothetical protein BDD43_3227 [Mucilaginibacter gracilis]
MKKIVLTLACATLLAACSGPQQNNVTIASNTTAGFDVNKLGEIVKTSTDPQVLEKAINDPKNNINNLDLDKDGKIDYLTVKEPGKNQLDVVDDTGNNQSITVASIKVDPTNNNTANLNIQGNPDYVGNNYMYHSSFSFTDFLLLSYLMRPHSYYVPMYHYGYYPSYYSRRTVVSNFRPTTSSAVSSPRRSSLSGSGSQRSFGTRNTSQGVRSGGFGSRRSSGFGSGSSSRRSYGSSRSFGRRR